MNSKSTVMQLLTTFVALALIDASVAEPQLRGLQAICSLPSELFSAARDPAKPTIPAEWTAQVNLSSGIAIHSLNAVKSTIFNDDTGKRMVQREFEHLDFLNNMDQNISIFLGADSALLDVNGVCRPLPGSKYGSIFSFLASPLTKYTSSVACGERTCDRWFFTYTKSAPSSNQINITGLFSNGIPVVLEISQNNTAGLPGMNSSASVDLYEFVSFKAEKPPASVWPPPPQCFSPAPHCKGGDTPVQTLEMVVAQPAFEISKYDISNQDTADWLGDTLFTCLDVTSGHTASDQYSTISLFEVEVDTRWGAYSLCNGYPVRVRCARPCIKMFELTFRRTRSHVV
jgi:hypothetical protein